MTKCTHSSDWWKEMRPCCVCGAMYSDEEAERIANESERKHPVFTAKQLAIISAHEAENEED